MAYMIDDKGPYPNKAGEYCGNHCIGSEPVLVLGESPQDTNRHQRAYLAKMRFGRPRATYAYTTRQLQGMGIVGLYLREDSPKRDGAVQISTPSELMEPELCLT